jgi:hypothetical protein
LRFAVTTFRTRAPVPSLGGARVRSKPLAPLSVIGPGGQDTLLTLVDSGADDVVFPAALAPRLGIDLSAAPAGAAQGVGSAQPLGLLYALVILLLTDGQELRRWRAVVAFTQSPLRFPLFGVAGGLEHFLFKLDVGGGEFLLEAKPTLPATQDLVP